MPRYVILRHEAPTGTGRTSHWDLMLERGGVLATWSLERLPDGAQPVAAEPLADHRLDYLDYEGPISGDRGTVARWDRGTCEVVQWDQEQIVAAVQGTRLVGRLRLQRAATAGDGPHRWTVVFETARPSSDGSR